MIVFINISPPQLRGSCGWRNWVGQLRIGWFSFPIFKFLAAPNVGRVELTKSLELAPRLQTLKDLFFLVSFREYLWKVSPLPSTALRYRSINFFGKSFITQQSWNKILFPFHEILCSRVLCFADGGQYHRRPPLEKSLICWWPLQKRINDKQNLVCRNLDSRFESNTDAMVTARLGGARGDGDLTRDTNLEGE